MEWTQAAHTMLRALVAYALVVACIRMSGNRTLAKMRAFDLVVTIALGTLLTAAIVSDSVPAWEALLALALLILLQWLVARLSVASRRFERLVTNREVRLVDASRLDEQAMRRARVTREEIESGARRAGFKDLSQVDQVWLEVNGDLSVIPRR